MPCTCPPGQSCKGSQWQPLRATAPPWFRAPMGSPEDMIAAAMAPQAVRVLAPVAPIVAPALLPFLQGSAPQPMPRPGARGRPRLVKRGGISAGDLRFTTARGGPRPAARAAGLGAVDEYVGRDCLDVRNDKGQPANDPCNVYCGWGDVNSWERLIKKLVTDARAGCHRTTKCHRVEELNNAATKALSLVGSLQHFTNMNMVETLVPIAQELSCLIAAAKAVGKHPQDPRPLPTPPPTGHGKPTTKPFIPGAAGFFEGLGGLAVAAIVIVALASAGRG